MHKVAAIAHAKRLAKMSNGKPVQDASHLCHHSVCMTVGHVIWEDPSKNQARKGCRVWVQCPHGQEMGCTLKVNVCPHLPRCIKTIPGVRWQDFKGNQQAFFHPDDDPHSNMWEMSSSGEEWATDDFSSDDESVVVGSKKRRVV